MGNFFQGEIERDKQRKKKRIERE